MDHGLREISSFGPYCTCMKGYKIIELILLNITGRRRIGGLKVNANLQ